MKQKLALIQAFMENPNIILLDEPMNGLDTQSAENLRKIITAEAGNGKLIIMASHYHEDLNNLCSSIFEMKDGILV